MLFSCSLPDCLNYYLFSSILLLYFKHKVSYFSSYDHYRLCHIVFACCMQTTWFCSFQMAHLSEKQMFLFSSQPTRELFSFRCILLQTMFLYKNKYYFRVPWEIDGRCKKIPVLVKLLVNLDINVE